MKIDVIYLEKIKYAVVASHTKEDIIRIYNDYGRQARFKWTKVDT